MSKRSQARTVIKNISCLKSYYGILDCRFCRTEFQSNCSAKTVVMQLMICVKFFCIKTSLIFLKHEQVLYYIYLLHLRREEGAENTLSVIA